MLRCKGKNKDGKRCKRKQANAFCYIHTLPEAFRPLPSELTFQPDEDMYATKNKRGDIIKVEIIKPEKSAFQKTMKRMGTAATGLSSIAGAAEGIKKFHDTIWPIIRPYASEAAKHLHKLITGYDGQLYKKPMSRRGHYVGRTFVRIDSESQQVRYKKLLDSVAPQIIKHVPRDVVIRADINPDALFHRYQVRRVNSKRR